MSAPLVSELWLAPLAFALSGCLAFGLLPLVSRVAVKLGAVDRPGGRRSHTTAVPRLGGVAVVFATAVACVSVAGLSGVSRDLYARPHILAVLSGALMVFLVGVLDDLRGVRPIGKLVVQLIAAIVVVQFSKSSNAFVLARGTLPFELDAVAPLLAVLWIVGVTNAFNLIDGLDGLASVCAIVAMATMAASGVYLGERQYFVFAAALLGALIAFLRRNWHPARVFLGDAGSMTIGFLLAVRSLPSATDQYGRLHALVPLAALAYPVLDTFVAIARRWLRGHSFSRADGRHIHHQLVTIGMSVPRAVTTIGVVATIVSGAALAITFAPPQLTVMLVVVSVLLANVAVVYAVWRLGYTEFIALGKSLYSGLARSRRVVRERIRMVDIAKQSKSITTEAELHECLRNLVDDTHIRRAELVDPYRFPRESIDEMAASPEYATALRLECPVRRKHVGRVMHLRVWVTSLGVAHHTIQRIESIICTELEAWYERFDQRVARTERVVRLESEGTMGLADVRLLTSAPPAVARASARNEARA